MVGPSLTVVGIGTIGIIGLTGAGYRIEIYDATASGTAAYDWEEATFKATIKAPPIPQLYFVEDYEPASRRKCPLPKRTFNALLATGLNRQPQPIVSHCRHGPTRQA